MGKGKGASKWTFFNILGERGHGNSWGTIWYRGFANKSVAIFFCSLRKILYIDKAKVIRQTEEDSSPLGSSLELPKVSPPIARSSPKGTLVAHDPPMDPGQFSPSNGNDSSDNRQLSDSLVQVLVCLAISHFWLPNLTNDCLHLQQLLDESVLPPAQAIARTDVLEESDNRYTAIAALKPDLKKWVTIKNWLTYRLPWKIFVTAGISEPGSSQNGQLEPTPVDTKTVEFFLSTSVTRVQRFALRLTTNNAQPWSLG